MDIKYRDMRIMDNSDDFFLLGNSKKLNVYTINGVLLAEFKVDCLSRTILFGDKIFVSQMYKKSLLYINISTGLRKRISFRKDVDGITGIYKKNDKELIIVSFRDIRDENDEIEHQTRIILYDVEENSYKLILMKKEESILNVLMYKGETYFVILLREHWKYSYHKIYRLKEGYLEECGEGLLEYRIMNFCISSDEKFFHINMIANLDS